MVKKTPMRNKLSKEAVGPLCDLGSTTDGDLVEEGVAIDDRDGVSIRGEEGNLIFN